MLDFLGNLSNHPLVEELTQEVDGNMRTAKERTTTDIRRYSPRLHIGETFVSEIDLRK